MCRAPSPNRSGSLRASTAASTRSRLSSGSPIPMKTTFVRRLPSVGQAARGVADLVDDLGRLEIPGEAELAGRAERAADRAARLARDAQRVALALGAARRVVHEDRLDERAVRQPMEPLLGQAAVGQAHLGVVDGVEAEGRGELLAERRRQRPDVVERSDVVRATPRRRPGGRGTPAGPPAPATRRDRRGRTPEMPGRASRRGPAPWLRPAGWPCAESTRSRSSTRPRRRPAGRHGRRSCPASTAGRGGTPRRSSAGRLPAGPRGARAGPRRSRARDRARSGTIRPGSSSASDGADAARQDDEPLAVGLEEGPRPRQVGPHLALEQPGRRGRVEPAVRPAERAGSSSRRPPACGVAAISPSSHGLQRAGEQPGGRDREAGLEGRRASRRRRGPSAPARRSARCRGRRPSGSGSRRSACRRRGSRRDRRGAAVARQERRVQVQRAVAPVEELPAARSGRSPRARRGPDRARGRRRSRPGRGAAPAPGRRGPARGPASRSGSASRCRAGRPAAAAP